MSTVSSLIHRHNIRFTHSCFVFIAVCMLIPITSAHAQNKGFSDQTTLGADGKGRETITNTSKVDITAFRLEYVCGSSSRMNYDYDSVIYPGGNAILHPSQSKSVLIPPPYSKCSGAPTAVIFSNGITAGNSTAIHALENRRKAFLAEIVSLQPLVEETANGSQSLLGIKAQLRARIQSIPTNNSYSLDEKTGRLRAAKRLLFECNIQGPPSSGVSPLAVTQKISSVRGGSERATTALAWIQQLRENISNAPPLIYPNQ